MASFFHTQQIKLSSDSNTLMMTKCTVDKSETNIRVFERQ
jgi:hypothetical protein